MQRSALGPEIAEWDKSLELQASTVDLLQYILRVLQVAHLKEPPTDPLHPVPRPYATDEPAPDEPAIPASEIMSFLKGV